MSYNKQNFISGQVLEAQHLNHMENGIGELDTQISQLSSEKVDKTSIVQTDGNSATSVMSQKAVTEFVNSQLNSGGTAYETVDSIDEMTVTSKSYVLSTTGTIWTYREVAGGANYTNVIPISVDANGAIFNSTGYQDGMRINSSGAIASSSTTSFATGFIPITLGDVVRFGGNHILTSHANAGSLNIGIYDSTKTLIITQNMALAFAPSASGSYGAFMEPLTNEEGYVVQAILNTNWSYTKDKDVAYVRLSLLGSGADAIMTINEEITEISGGYQWVDTGIVPSASSNSEAIVNLQNDVESLKVKASNCETSISELGERVAELENGDTNSTTIPDYWREAVDALADTIKEKQNTYGSDAFQFLWFSDLHGINGYTNTNGAGTSVVKNIGYVAQYAAEKYDIPFVAISGDIHSQASHASESSVWSDYDNIRKILSPIDRDKLIYTKGNHDGAWGAPVDGVYYLNNIGGKKIYNALFRNQALDRSRVFGGDGSYFYVDSPQKIRFIMLNCQTDGDGSRDVNGYPVYNSMKNSIYGTEQLSWVSDVALDLPQGWRAIFMTHQHPNSSKDGSLLAGIINAYINKTTYNGSVNATSTYWGNGVTDATYTQISASADFSNANGEVVALFHGHIHKDNIDTSTYSFPCIAITTAGADVRDGEPVERVIGTATETAIDIVTIASDNIYMTRLGAGSDRSLYEDDNSTDDPENDSSETTSYTNLFDASGSGFTKQSDTKYLTNWIPYNVADNDGKGTIYHLKGFANNANYTNPYKMHFATDANGTSASELMYCTNASVLKNVVASYDSDVKLVQHTAAAAYKYVQFEFREALPENLIITANEPIVD